VWCGRGAVVRVVYLKAAAEPTPAMAVPVRNSASELVVVAKSGWRHQCRAMVPISITVRAACFAAVARQAPRGGVDEQRQSAERGCVRTGEVGDERAADGAVERSEYPAGDEGWDRDPLGR
jgi:hypothetical protein